MKRIISVVLIFVILSSLTCFAATDEIKVWHLKDKGTSYKSNRYELCELNINDANYNRHLDEGYTPLALMKKSKIRIFIPENSPLYDYYAENGYREIEQPIEWEYFLETPLYFYDKGGNVIKKKDPRTFEDTLNDNYFLSPHIAVYKQSEEKIIPVGHIKSAEKNGWSTIRYITMYNHLGQTVEVLPNSSEYKKLDKNYWAAEPYVTMYTQDGTPTLVHPDKVNNHPELLSEEPTINLYKPDQEIIVKISQLNFYQVQGWYTEPVAHIYHPSGETKIVPTSEIEKKTAEGWYAQSAVTMYHPNGQNQKVYVQQIEEYKTNGWYETTSVLMYAADGTNKKVEITNIEAEKTTGIWYEYPVLFVYNKHGDIQTIPVSTYNDWAAAGWFAGPITTMYALDGRTEVIPEKDLNAWKNSGWYNIPEITVYHKNGNSFTVPIAEAGQLMQQGWFPGPATTMYALDGNIEVIPKRDLGAWENSGWFNTPQINVYHKNGNQFLVPVAEAGQLQKEGWYITPTITMYAPDGSYKEVKIAEIESEQASGWWYDYPVISMYHLDGRVAHAPKSDIKYWEEQGWYTYPVITMYDVYGNTQVIPQKDKVAWENAGWYDHYKPLTTKYYSVLFSGYGGPPVPYPNTPISIKSHSSSFSPAKTVHSASLPYDAYFDTFYSDGPTTVTVSKVEQVNIWEIPIGLSLETFIGRWNNRKTKHLTPLISLDVNLGTKSFTLSPGKYAIDRYLNGVWNIFIIVVN